MNATKERWQTPRTAFERFVTDRYVAACADTGNWEVSDQATSIPYGKYYLDLNHNGILDLSEKNDKDNLKNSNQVSGREVNENISYWGWEQNNLSVRYRVFPLLQGQSDHWAAFEERWVSNRNHS